MTGEYPANIAIWYHIYTALASAGLTWDDVKVVPVPAVNDGVDALVQGRADVSNHAIGAAKVKEADTSVGVRYLSLDCTPQGDARVRKAVPGYYITTLKAGASTGIVGDTCVLSYDIYWVGHKGLSNEVVTHSLKAIWDNIDKLPPSSPVPRLDPRTRRIRRRDGSLSSRRRAVLQREKFVECQNGRGAEKIAGPESVGARRSLE